MKGASTGWPFAKLVERLRADRKLELFVYAAVVGAVLIIFALSGGISCGEADRAGVGADKADPSYPRTDDEIENRLSEMLSGIRGAGRVKVMIMRGSGREEAPDDGGIEGIWNGGRRGSASASGAYSAIEGVMVTAEGADDIRVRTDIQSAVRTLLGIGADRIGVYSMQKQYSEQKQNGGN